MSTIAIETPTQEGEDEASPLKFESEEKKRIFNIVMSLGLILSILMALLFLAYSFTRNDLGAILAYDEGYCYINSGYVHNSRLFVETIFYCNNSTIHRFCCSHKVSINQDCTTIDAGFRCSSIKINDEPKTCYISSDCSRAVINREFKTLKLAIAILCISSIVCMILILLVFLYARFIRSFGIGHAYWIVTITFVLWIILLSVILLPPVFIRHVNPIVRANLLIAFFAIETGLLLYYVLFIVATLRRKKLENE